MNISMKENNFNYVELLSEMNKNIIESVNYSKKKENNNYNLKFNSKRNTFLYKNEIKNNIYRINIERKIKPMNYPQNGLNDIRTYFYLIDNISNKCKGMFLVDYNTTIKVKEVPDKIRQQLNKEKNQNINKEKLEKIIKSPGFKLVLNNSLGFFVKFLDEPDYDITHLLKNDDINDKKNVKHLCLYNLTQLNEDIKIKNIIIINFISNSLLDSIISKNEDIYENYNFEQINIPGFIINETINGKKNLNNRIKDIYIEYFGVKAQKINKFKIYIITNKDILNMDILKITYLELTEDNFLFYIDTNINYTNLLVGY